jgi:hypothetical protein
MARDTVIIKNSYPTEARIFRLARKPVSETINSTVDS